MAAIAVAVAVTGLVGCVERKLLVRSDPPGARIFLDGEPQGVTPASIPFTFYGTREVVLRAPGRKTARVVVPLAPPWYQVMPIDFFAEVLLPVTVVDERLVEAKLEPRGRAGEADLEALRRRAEERREEGAQ